MNCLSCCTEEHWRYLADPQAATLVRGKNWTPNPYQHFSKEIPLKSSSHYHLHLNKHKVSQTRTHKCCLCSTCSEEYIFHITAVNDPLEAEPPLDPALWSASGILSDINKCMVDLELPQFSDRLSRRLGESCGIFAEFHPAVLNREECLWSVCSGSTEEIRASFNWLINSLFKLFLLFVKRQKCQCF